MAESWFGLSRVDFTSGYAHAVVADGAKLPAMVEVGDRAVPAMIDMVFPGVDGQPKLTARFEVVDGYPQCRDLHISSHDDGRGIRPLDIEAIRVNDWTDTVFAAFANDITDRSDGRFIASGPTTDMLGTLGDFGRARQGKGARKITPAFLQKVADVYRENFDGNPTQAVADTFGVAHRTASLYLTKARAAKLLPATTTGKKKA